MARARRELFRLAPLALTVALHGCVIVECREKVEAREPIAVAEARVEAWGVARLTAAGDGEFALRSEAVESTFEQVTERVTRSASLTACVESRTADLVFGSAESGDLPVACCFGVAMLPGAILSPIVTGICALAVRPFAGGTEVETSERERRTAIALVDAELRDHSGRSLPVGALGGERKAATLSLASLDAAGLGPPPWRLVGRDARDGRERSIPVVLDDAATRAFADR